MVRTGCVTPPSPAPIGDRDGMLWPTVVLLIRQAGARNRVVYNLSPARDAPEPPPRPPTVRSTARKLREPGETRGSAPSGHSGAVVERPRDVTVSGLESVVRGLRRPLRLRRRRSVST